MIDVVSSCSLLAVLVCGAPGGGGIQPPRPAPTFPRSAPASPPSVVPTSPPPPPTGGVFGGHDPLDRKLRVDRDRLRELADDQANDVARTATPIVVAGALGDRLALDLSKRAAAAFEFDAVRGTRFEFVARIDGGRASGTMSLCDPGGVVRAEVVVSPGRVARLDAFVATSTGTYRLELRPQPGDARGTLLVSTKAFAPADVVETVTLADGRPVAFTLSGVRGRSLRSAVLRMPSGAASPRPYVDLASPSGVVVRVASRVVEGDPTRIELDAVALDELGEWTLRIADLSREERAGSLTLAFEEQKPGRKSIEFENP
ncbi:MAG: hypothetical protein IPH13_21405 [Planctomycetes bacterium]|nr:hypothetical protein [Planctomycetota bacterium]MCC7169897.1 hypothetical protein [Planctomycetota bacterium]